MKRILTLALFFALCTPVHGFAQTSPDTGLGYLKQRLNTYSLSMNQFLALSTEDKRLALAPGQQLYLSREKRHAIVPFHQPVPQAVLSPLSIGHVVDNTVSERYAVRLSQPELKQWLLIGNRLLRVDAENTILESSVIE